MSEASPTLPEAHAVRPPQSRAQRLVAWAVWLGAVAILGLLGYALVTGAGKPGRPAGVTINSQTATLAVLDRPAPDFSLTRFGTGETVRLSDLRGQVVVLNFWASWCPPCRQEAPTLERIWREYKDRGVVFVGIDIWDTDADAARFLQEFGITYPNGPDPNGEIAIEYGLTGIPETYFITRDGMIAQKAIGIVPEETFRRALDALLQP
ncbi:MAG: TlpA family protein disulfide reductase [Ardenticatenaceae bacterium]|nr:TlpA family protein disulfide reductase [Ardenticatenaceae bacterium]